MLEIKQNSDLNSQINSEENNKIKNNNNYENNNNLHNNISSSYNAAINNPIVMQLIEFGFDPIYSSRIFLYYHPQNVDDALEYLNNVNGIIQHHFVIDRENIENEICYLCGEKKDIHLGYIPQNSIKNDNLNEILNNLSLYSFEADIKEDKKEKLEKSCDICGNSFIPNSDNTLINCGHSFCNDCWYNFLSLKIQENKISSIKCLNYECQEKLKDKFIIKIIESNKILIEKYKKFNLELEIINNPNKKFCPFPNCNSYLEKKNLSNNDVKCLNGHKFCFKCLKDPHGVSPCKNRLDDSLIEFSKNHFFKKCPRCSIITEKIEGCNHITCSKCSYQWCWLCNGEYNPEHFSEGKCKGYQFFKPKNEKDIKLAFEGKIVLNLSQRQIDTFDEFDRPNLPNQRRRNIISIDNIINAIGYPRNYYLFKCGKITRIFLIFIYILFGYDLIILNAIKKYLPNFHIFYIIFYSPYRIAFFFWHIYFNIINLIFYLFNYGFMNFTSLVYDTLIFKHHYGFFRKYFFKICLLSLGFLCLSFFFLIKLGKKKFRIRNKYKLAIYYFTSIILIIIFFPIQFLFNIIIILIHLFCKRDSFNNIFDDINEELKIIDGFYYNIHDN